MIFFSQTCPWILLLRTHGNNLKIVKSFVIDVGCSLYDRMSCFFISYCSLEKKIGIGKVEVPETLVFMLPIILSLN